MSNEAGVQMLREWREWMAGRSAAKSPPPFPCPECGAAVTVTFGRNRKKFNGFHPSTTGCHFNSFVWHLEAGTREAALAEWELIPSPAEVARLRLAAHEEREIFRKTQRP